MKRFLSLIERGLKRLLLAVLRIFFSRKDASSVSFHHVHSILIIRQHNQLGDMLCAVPVFRALRERFPSATISLIASPDNYDVVFCNPYLNEVINYDKTRYVKSLRELYRFYRTLRKRKYDLALVPATVSTSVTSDAMAWLSGAPLRIGAESIDGKKNPSGFFFNIRVALDWRQQPLKHQTERNLDLVRAVGMNTRNLSLTIGLSGSERAFAREFLRQQVLEDSIAIGIHPGAGKPPNRWATEKFAALVNKLAEQFNALIVVTYGPMDDEPIADMLRHVNHPHVVLQRINIREVAAVIDELSLFITNDTGIMHVAAATRTSVLSIFGPTDPLQWAPQGKRNKFLLGKNGDINSISVEKVFRVAARMLYEREHG
jgi:heptosyltransferase-2